MEALKLKTFADLEQASLSEERIELMDGEIVKRPMPRFSHSMAQSGLSGQFFPLWRQGDEDGWWIVTEVSVRYNEHHCPAHDLAGWRKSRVPNPPTSVMDVTPDWVCEITSPGHERKDLVTQLLRLQSFQVPHYWIISPEDQTLLAYALTGGHYQLAYSVECRNNNCDELCIPPFENLKLDFSFVFAAE